ncbi:hypothetical protein B0J12DRAFT_760449 [Macrophomina phaseolina]|uniref:Uncharacterized protein n=1 Tax=Macrophomina phaseolina TaxID=35725 RepID=A0ABQ8G3Z9_9PEZI|nr:hypothetical protein B0J12DRAFT_760449 [Macrophomina phaseolina]
MAQGATRRPGRRRQRLQGWQRGNAPGDDSDAASSATAAAAARPPAPAPAPATPAPAPPPPPPPPTTVTTTSNNGPRQCNCCARTSRPDRGLPWIPQPAISSGIGGRAAQSSRCGFACPPPAPAPRVTPLVSALSPSTSSSQPPPALVLEPVLGWRRPLARALLQSPAFSLPARSLPLRSPPPHLSRPWSSGSNVVSHWLRPAIAEALAGPKSAPTLDPRSTTPVHHSPHLSPTTTNRPPPLACCMRISLTPPGSC